MKLKTIFLSMILSLATTLTITAAPPQTMNYQGYLTNTAGTPLNGSHAMVFSLYNAPSGGTALWTETQTVTVSNGLYNVILGSINPIGLVFDVQYYLGINVNNDGEMTPRGTLTSAPYAFRAVTVQTDPTPAGVISAFAGSVAPAGYLLCDGSAVSRTTYAALFAVIGITHGQGNGTTTFNLPDYRGRFLRGVDGTAGNDPDNSSCTAMNVGGSVGNNVGSVQTDAFQGHWHTGKSGPVYGVIGSGIQEINPTYGVNGGDIGITSPITDGSNGTPRITSETRPTNAYVNFIIKY